MNINYNFSFLELCKHWQSTHVRKRLLIVVSLHGLIAKGHLHQYWCRCPFTSLQLKLVQKLPMPQNTPL